MLEKLPRSAIIAHRGASAYTPENTLAAFELAVRQGADAIELDTKMCADGHVVVIHDQTVDRTTQGSGKVHQLSLNELQSLDAGSHFDPAFEDVKIPTLDAVFETVGKSIYINIEIANYATPLDNLPEEIANQVERHQLTQRVFFSSFNPLALTRIRRLIPQAPIGLLALPGFMGLLARSWPGRFLNYQSLHLNLRDVSLRLLTAAHNRGCRVFVYTVNQIKEMHHLFEMGVDGIFTDDPVKARQVLTSM
jgi:glycerophosphoryl diester phosphodiesterase